MDTKLINRAKRHLRQADKVMVRLVKTSQLAPSKTSRPHFHALVRAIISQQLSVKAAATIEQRLLVLHGGRHFKSETMKTLTERSIRECGVSHKKIHYIQTLAQAVIAGELNFRKLARQDNETVSQTLIQYPGIGPWSADMFLINSLQRADIFPVGDLVIRQSMQHHYKLPKDAAYEKYLTIAVAWQPYRTIASFCLWQNRPSR